MILRVPGGRVSSAQLKAVAKAVSCLEAEFADITPLRTLRLPEIPPDLRPELLRQLGEAGFSEQDPVGPGGEAPGEGRDLAGVLEQDTAELFTLGIPVLAGRLSASQLRKAADVAERYGGGSLNLTPRQNLLIPNVPKEKVAQALEALDAVDLRVSASAWRRGLTCCSAEKDRAIELVTYLEKQVPVEEPIGLHFSDFPCSCPAAAVSLVRLEGRQTCDIRLGGRLTVSGVPTPQVKSRLEKMVVGFKRGRAASESFSEFFRRVGDEEMTRLLSEDPVSAS